MSEQSGGLGPWLAMYDFRTKQQYIYRTNRLQEIIGASRLITAAYDCFLIALENCKPAIRVARNYVFEGDRYINDAAASAENFGDFSDGAVQGKVLNVGGGTLYILWESEATCLRAAAVFCRVLREQMYGLCPVSGMAKYTGNYAEDMKALRESFETCKATVPPMIGAAYLPFTELDRKTSQPVFCKEKDLSLSRESWLKQTHYSDIRSTKEGDSLAETNLDKLVEERGRESLLAIIYVDGNNMGERVGRVVGNGTDYADLVPKLRRFSNGIQDSYVTQPVSTIRDWANANGKACRLVVAGGDEITIICNANDALELVQAYFKCLKAINPENTACAGICVFHSHFPFSTAYAIAEACCENAKKRNRLKGSHHNLVDFQFLYATVSGDLEDMRETDGRFMERPYALDDDDADFTSLSVLIEAALRLGRSDALRRANLKNLASLLFQAGDAYEMERMRLNALYRGVLKVEDKALMLDIAQFYDIWFAKRVKKAGEEAAQHGADHR